MATVVDIACATPTLDRVDRACAVLHTPDGERLHLDDLLAGQTAAVLPEGHEAPLLAVVAPTATVPAAYVQQVGRTVGQQWLQAVMQEAAAASERAAYYAQRCAVHDVLAAQDASASLARTLARFSPEAHHRIWHTMPLADALTYLMLRAVDHVSENLDDYV